jgi:protein-S-isoprenylcysteine O-methyltransferase Ste14
MGMGLVEATVEQTRELPVPAAVIGLGTLAVFAVLLAVTWAFRSVGRRH